MKHYDEVILAIGIWRYSLALVLKCLVLSSGNEIHSSSILWYPIITISWWCLSFALLSLYNWVFVYYFLVYAFGCFNVLTMVSTTTGRTEHIDANMVHEIHIMQIDGWCRWSANKHGQRSYRPIFGWQSCYRRMFFGPVLIDDLVMHGKDNEKPSFM